MTTFIKIRNEMNEGREIAGIFIPFAAGVTSGTFLVKANAPGTIILTATLAATIICFLRFRIAKKKSLAQAAVSFFFLGMFASASWGNLNEYDIEEPSRMVMAARSVSEKTKTVIDSIPFRSQESGQLVKALLTGDKSGLSQSTIEAFRDSGAAHILALSGLHLGIIYTILVWLTSFLGHTPEAVRTRFLLITLTSGFYAIATGAAPSITRAFLFILLNETTKITHRKKKPENILLAALTVQLAVNPGIITSAGFQLSYMAMAGIYFIFPVMSGWFDAGRNNPVKRIWDTAAMSVSCQILTAPVAWFRFRTFPEYFLLTNLIALPLTSCIMILSVGVILLSAIGICPTILIVADEWLIGLMTGSLEIIMTM